MTQTSSPTAARRATGRNVVAVLVVAAILQAVGTFGINLWRYRTFRVAGPLDLSYYNQQLWNAWHGNSPITIRPKNAYVVEGPEPWKTNHLRPVTLVLLALHRIWPGVPMFFAFQSLVLASGVWPAFRLGRHASGQALCGMFCGLAYAAAPVVWLLGTTDFRYLHLGVPFVLWTYEALDRRSPRQLSWCALALFATRESYSVVVAAMGFSQLFRRRPVWENLRWAAAAVATGFVWFWIHVAYLWCAFGPDSAAGYLQATRNPAGSYGQSTSSMWGELRREGSRLAIQLGGLVLGAAAAPELAVPGIALAYPPLRMGLFTLHPSQQYVRYFAPAASLLLAGLFVSLGRVWRRFSPSRVPLWGAGVVVALLATQSVLGMTLREDSVLRLKPRVGAGEISTVRDRLSRIPADDGVLAFRGVLPSLSARCQVYDYHQLPPGVTLERAIADSDWIVVERLLVLLGEMLASDATPRETCEQFAKLIAIGHSDAGLTPAEWMQTARTIRAASAGFRVDASLQSMVVLRRSRGGTRAQAQVR